MRLPSIGDVVLYFMIGHETNLSGNGFAELKPYPALVNAVNSDNTINVTVFTSHGIYAVQNVVFGPSDRPGYWSRRHLNATPDPSQMSREEPTKR